MLKSFKRSKAIEQKNAINASSFALNGSSALMQSQKQQQQLIPPPDQLKLTEKELDEELTRILNANNPAAPQNISRWSTKDKTFKTLPFADHLMVNFEYEGYMVYKGSEEEESTAQTDDIAAVAALDKKSARPKNPFNYGQRASQTPFHGTKDRSSNTDPPPSKIFGGSVTQWEIYDAYQEDLAAKERSKEKKGKKDDIMESSHSVSSFPGNSEFSSTSYGPSITSDHEDYKMSKDTKSAVAILERMCNQNTYDEVTMDYKYWEDGADDFREGKGVLLPLWKFIYDKDKKKHQVTSLCWHSSKTDFFATGFGSYDFKKQGNGFIVCFSLKNPSWPEYLIKTESGVMCLEFHPTSDSWIAAGLYDGTVAIFDLSLRTDAPIYKSQIKTGKHTEPVWEIKWQPNDLDEHINFVSVSSDGRVVQWTLLKNELVGNDIILLGSDSSDPTASMENIGKNTVQISGGTCFDINKKNPDIVIVGAEDGKIYKCSKEYNRQYLKSYEPHQLGVYALKYNPFCANVFLSASADWTVKLWDHDLETPVLTFDLGQSVGDISWSPYSSTVFSAVTSDGRIIYYDINVSKYDPICEQAVTNSSKLTHLAHNRFTPILIAGDDQGQILSFKLSPNLRKNAMKGQETQEEKMERVINAHLGRKSQDDKFR